MFMRGRACGALGVLALALLAALPHPARATPLEEALADVEDEDGRPPRLVRSRLPPLTWRELARPEPLSAEEEALPVLETLARRYNPAMVFPTRDIWPVEVRYGWHDGSDLRSRVVSPDGRVLREATALPHEALVSGAWPAALPERDDDGNRIEYYVDAPGDDRMKDGVSGWKQRWRAIMGGDPAARGMPHGLEYKPTQYVHFFWFNRDKGLLAVQYWFYYPYNEWINHHEGDWEHINVILRGPTTLASRASFKPAGYQFFFHHWTYEPTQVLRIRGADPREDHVVVYAGGQSRFLLWKGCTSGGSYPLPAVYPAAGGGFAKWRPAEDTTKPARFVRPEAFQTIVLPEPERVDVEATPELAWLRLPFFAGQSRMFGNPLAMNRFNFGEAPAQPARQAGWNARANPPYWTERPRFDAQSLKLPRTWQAVATPPQRAAEFVAARRGRARAAR
jgi:hypothetical protein